MNSHLTEAISFIDRAIAEDADTTRTAIESHGGNNADAGISSSLWQEHRLRTADLRKAREHLLRAAADAAAMQPPPGIIIDADGAVSKLIINEGTQDGQ